MNETEEYESFARIMDCCVELLPTGERCERSDVVRFAYCAEHYARHKCHRCDQLHNAYCTKCRKQAKSRMFHDMYWRCREHTMQWCRYGMRRQPFLEDGPETEFLCPACIEAEADVRCASLREEERLARLDLDAVFKTIRCTPILNGSQCNAFAETIYQKCEIAGPLSDAESAVYNSLLEANSVFSTYEAYARCMVQHLYQPE